MWKIWKYGEKTKKKEINNRKVKKANKVNNDLKLNVDEQEDDIKHLKEQLKDKALCVTCNPSITRTKHIKETKKSPFEIMLAKCYNKERK